MTKIEWASLGLPNGVSWNPIRARNAKTGKTGWYCEKLSPACVNCYAERLNMKAGDTGGTGLPYKPGHRQNGDVEVYLDETTLLKPLHWKKPRGVFVCSMIDLFGDWVPDEWIDQIYAVMALCPQHRFAVLTKRTKRMREIVSRIVGLTQTIRFDSTVICDEFPHITTSIAHPHGIKKWPLPNVWLGVTAEDQTRANERIPDLLATPAAVRFASVEPMLAPVDLKNIKPADRYELDALLGFDYETGTACNRLDWVICGGESGPDARPMHPDWARSLRDQCAATVVAYFHKQNGEWIDADELWRAMRADGVVLHHGGTIFAPEAPMNYEAASRIADAVGAKQLEHHSDGSTLIRVGKARAGRLLDGIERSEFPEAL